MRNLEIMFPEKSHSWRVSLLKDNARELGRFVSDAIRLETLTTRWVDEHFEGKEFIEQMQTFEKEGKRVLLISGHVGSFELVPTIWSLLGLNHSIIVRPFHNPYLDRYWNYRRELQGTKVIPRSGALRKVIRTLQTEHHVGFLFDQNVRANNGIFVPLGTLPASFTVAPSVLVAHTQCPVLMFYLRYYPEIKKYRIEFKVLDKIQDILNRQLNKKDQQIELTRYFAAEFEEFCLNAYPEGWFWMHRRWKTRPYGEPETIYSNSKISQSM